MFGADDMTDKVIRVLLIDDDADDAFLAQHALSQCVDAKYSVQHVTCLADAADELRAVPFDVVLLDLGLPESSGNETLTRFSSMCPRQVPIIVLTGLDDQEAALGLVNDGAQDYLVKDSVTSETLSRSIRYALQRHQNVFRIRELLGEVQQSRELLERKNKKLAKLYDQAHEFVDNVSHEFRTPLTVVKEYVSLIRDGLVGDVNEEQKRMLHVVEDRADDLNIMVDDMLDVSKLEAGMLGAWRKNNRVEEILNHVRASLERKAAVRNVTLQWSIEDDLPQVYCDDEKVGRVLTNLAINAIKFCGDPGVVRVAAYVDEVAGNVVFSISDNGPGIDEDSLASIFHRFKQLASDTRGSTKGFGLGLNIAKALVDLNFGQMNVESQLGKGSTFSFTVPVADPIEVAKRYLHRIERVEQVEDNTLFVSVVTASIAEDVSEALADDMDAFLNCCLRKNDLLFRVGRSQWVVAVPEPDSELDAYETRIQKEWSDANRNRPFGPLPKLDLRSAGSWRSKIHEQEILECIEQILEPLATVAV